MGDKIIIEAIELINDTMLIQIDYYNETKNYHGRMFVNTNLIMEAEERETKVEETRFLAH